MSFLTRELEYFLGICDAGSIGRAAEVLRIAQPTLTLSLQRLEAKLHTRLFVRTSKGVEMTPIGSALRARVSKARIALDDAEREVDQLAVGMIGRLRVGAGHLLAPLVRRALFPRLIVERPAAQIQFHVALNLDLFARLNTGRLDLAVCGLPNPPPGLSFRELLTSSLSVVVRKGHPLTRMARPTMHDLAKFPAAASIAPVHPQQIVEGAFARLGIPMLANAIESNSLDALYEVVAVTDLYTLAPKHGMLLLGAATTLVSVAIEGFDVKYRCGIVTRGDGYLSPLAERAIDLIVDNIANEAERERAKAPQSRELVRERRRKS